MSEDLDMSAFTAHKIIIIKKNCLCVNVVCVVEYQGRLVECDINFFGLRFDVEFAVLCPGCRSVVVHYVLLR